jgi:hypothetical protein
MVGLLSVNILGGTALNFLLWFQATPGVSVTFSLQNSIGFSHQVTMARSNSNGL